MQTESIVNPSSSLKQEIENVPPKPVAASTQPMIDQSCAVLSSTKHGENSLSLTGRTIEFNCPSCINTPLEIGRFGEKVEVCFCPQCYGFAIDSATLGALIAELRIAYHGAEDKPNLLNHRDLEKQISCPACHDRMEVHTYYGPGNVVIDSCPHCKIVWFNQGELNGIIRAPGRR